MNIAVSMTYNEQMIKVTETSQHTNTRLQTQRVKYEYSAPLTSLDFQDIEKLSASLLAMIMCVCASVFWVHTERR